MKECPSCHATLRDNEKSCHFCGADCTETPVQTETLPSDGEMIVEQKQKKSKKKLILGITAGILGAGLLVGGIIVLPPLIKYMQVQNFSCGIEGDYEYVKFEILLNGKNYGFDEDTSVLFEDEMISVYDGEILDVPVFDTIDLEVDSRYGLLAHGDRAHYRCENYTFDEGAEYDIEVTYDYKEERLRITFSPVDETPLFSVTYRKD